jgi:hypothetical protein
LVGEISLKQATLRRLIVLCGLFLSSEGEEVRGRQVLNVTGRGTTIEGKHFSKRTIDIGVGGGLYDEAYLVFKEVA